MILQEKAEQFTITVPKKLVEAMGWKARDVLSFEVGGKDKLMLSKKADS